LRQVIATADAPEAVGAYSQGIVAGGMLYCSGQLPLDPSTGEIVKLDAAGQARRCLDNLEAVCRAAATSLRRAVRVTLYLADMADFQAVNAAYEEYFPSEPPARVAVGAASLPRGADVEIEAIVEV
jgi:2-iminobutanoate/2-iminopropanoate deaminase